MKNRLLLIILFFISLGYCVAQSATSKQLNQTQMTATAPAPVPTITDVQLALLPSPLPTSFPKYSSSKLIASSQGLVKLSYPITAAARPTGEASVKVAIEYYVLNNDILERRTKDEELKISLQPSAVKNIAFVKLPEAIAIKLITLSEVNIPATFTSIVLEASVEGEVYDVLNLQKPQDINPGFVLAHNDTKLTTDGILEVTWSPLAGAVAYELEWTYVSDQDGANVDLRLPLDRVQLRDYLFRTNSSRVVTVNTNYSIPMVYEKGLILYRVRAVGKNIVNGKITEVKSLWSADENFTNLSSYPVANIYLFDGLEADMNWQSSISYAEEGKNKVVVSYHDGSSRNRQAVTKINTDKRAIIGETMYDYNGRPQIQVLPVPVKENTVDYTPHFNLIEGASRIEKSQYDVAMAGNGCTVVAPKFVDTKGASNYYSPKNGFDGVGGNTGQQLLNKDLIPDAKLYPYTQTYYTNDNTGRIAAQSGVGDNYLIGSNHETRYLYGAPDQEEITRLFGTQVGHSGHYKKNVVIDPNGQTSVSYLDMDGKVIATALAGKTPDNVSTLEADKTRNIRTNLLDNVTYPLSSSGDSKEYISTFTVTQEAKYKFEYTGTVGGYSFSCRDKNGVNKQVNLAGVVDVEFKLIDKCKNMLIETFGTTNYSTTSAATQAINMPISVGANSVPGEITLQPGEYNVIKRVKLNEEKLEAYWDFYANNRDLVCVLSDKDFETEELNKVDLSGCKITCEACKVQTADLLQNADVNLSVEERYRIERLCDNLCSPNIKCLAGLNVMLSDMAPGGQYGEIRRAKTNQATIGGPDKNDFANSGVQYNNFDIDLPGIDKDGNDPNPDDDELVPETFPMSIYNDNNRIKVPNFLCTDNRQINWRRPIRIYFNDAGSSTGTSSTLLYTNSVLFDGSKDFSTAIYQEIDYRDIQGEVVYAKLTKLEDNSYKPAVTDPSRVTPVDEIDGLYQVPIRYLANFKDFFNYWQSHFANYLVVYHPEFQYFVSCTGQKSSNAFEQRLQSSGELLEAKSQNFIVNGNHNVLEEDPLLKDDSKAKQRIKQLHDNYAGTGKPLNVVVSKAIDCPGSADQCLPGLTDAVCENGKLDSQEKWQMYLGLYLSIRQAYEHDRETQKAIQNGYYNGCIGDKDYRFKRDARGLTQISVRPAITINRCSFNFWWRWRILGNPTNCCITIPRAQYSIFNIPIADFSQTCNWWSASRYYNKVKRFEYTDDTQNNGLAVDEENCQVNIPAMGSDPAYTLDVACSEQLQKKIELNTRDVEIYKYEKCGLCPIANDLEVFLLELKKRPFIGNGQSTLITCISNADFTSLGKTLVKQFIPNNNDVYATVHWQGTYSADKKTLTGTLKNLTANITRNITLQIPANVPKNLTQINFCCLSPEATTVNGVHRFTLEASYTENNQKVKFNIDGTIDVSLAPCSFPPRCYATSQATNMTNFLNTLLIDTYKTKQLQSVEVALDADAVRDYYEPNVRNLINKDAVNDDGSYAQDFSTFAPKWIGTRQANGELAAELRLTNTSISRIDINITPTIPNSIADYNLINRFTNVRPLGIGSCAETLSVCENTSFIADALIINTDGSRSYKEVAIQVSGLTMTICKPVVFGGK